MPSIPQAAETSAPRAREPHVDTVMLIRVNEEPWMIYVDRARVAKRYETRAEAALALIDHDTGRAPFVFET